MNRTKLLVKLQSLQDIEAPKELIEWIRYKIDMWDQGEIISVNINPDRNTTSSEGFTTAVYYPPNYVDQWKSKKVSYKGFMNWKIKQILD